MRWRAPAIAVLLGLALPALLLAPGCAKDSEVTRPAPARPSVPPHPRPPVRVDDAQAELDPAGRRGVEVARGLPLPITPRRHLFLGTPHDGSLSIGTVTDGWLYAGAQLPLDGQHHRVTTTQRQRGTNFGTQELVGAVERAAAAVAKRFPGAVLQVGNMAKGGGGDIPWSVSHNNGRDVDLAFYLLAPDGSQPALDDLVRLDAAGRPADLPLPLRFDPARNWALMKALLTDPTIEPQYVFVANPLKAMMLQHAKGRGESKALLAKADVVLRQPVGALPHDDHFHLRIHCPRSNVAEGCVDSGRVRPGLDLNAGAGAERVPKLVKALGSKRPARRAAAAFLLATLGARETAPAIAKRLGDKDVSVRLEALDALERLGAFDQVERIQRRARKDSHGPVVRRAVQALAALASRGSDRARSALVELLPDRRALTAPRGLSEETFTVQAKAAEALGRLAVRRAVPALATALEGADPETLRTIEEALALLTNRTTDDLRAAGGPPDAAQAWAAWVAQNGTRSPLDWLVEGFNAAGHPMTALDARAAPTLVAAVLDTRDHVSFNAQRGLMSIAKGDPGSLAWSREDAWAHWSRWARKNASRLRSECQRIEKAERKKAAKAAKGGKKGKGKRGR